MDKIISSIKLSGEIQVPESKSLAHRLLVCQALSDNDSGIICESKSRDILATRRCLDALGLIGVGVDSEVPYDEDGTCYCDCGDSGTTYRFLLPVAAALGKKTEFVLRGRLPERPMEPLYKALRVHGIHKEEASMDMLMEDGSTERVGHVRISGKLTGGTFVVPGNISSQFISGLLLALPILPISSTIIVEGELQSISYVVMTMAAMERAGVRVKAEKADDKVSYVFRVNGGQHYHFDGPVEMERDWSQAAFWLCAGAIDGGPVTCTGMEVESFQGDRRIINILEAFGADVRIESLYDPFGNRVPNRDRVTVSADKMHGIKVDAGDIPDLVPIIALLGCKASGKTIIRNAGRLRLKESDRLESICAALNAIGGRVRVVDNGLVIDGFGRTDGNKQARYVLNGGRVDSANDHRIAMMAAVAACISKKSVEIAGSECVNKSYPDFFDDLASLQKIEE